MHRAAVRGELSLVQMLIARGSDVNASDGDEYTPLMLAARGGHGKILDYKAREIVLEGGRLKKHWVPGATAVRW
ncbi:Potassium channel AKT1 [Linum perenne]